MSLFNFFNQKKDAPFFKIVLAENRAQGKYKPINDKELELVSKIVQLINTSNLHYAKKIKDDSVQLANLKKLSNDFILKSTIEFSIIYLCYFERFLDPNKHNLNILTYLFFCLSYSFDIQKNKLTNPEYNDFYIAFTDRRKFIIDAFEKIAQQDVTYFKYCLLENPFSKMDEEIKNDLWPDFNILTQVTFYTYFVNILSSFGEIAKEVLEDKI